MTIKRSNIKYFEKKKRDQGKERKCERTKS